MGDIRVSGRESIASSRSLGEGKFCSINWRENSAARENFEAARTQKSVSRGNERVGFRSDGEQSFGDGRIYSTNWIAQSGKTGAKVIGTARRNPGTNAQKVPNIRAGCGTRTYKAKMAEIWMAEK